MYMDSAAAYRINSIPVSSGLYREHGCLTFGGISAIMGQSNGGDTVMKILVDADACPVVRITEQLAREHGIACMLLCDTNHVLTSEYSSIHIIGAGADAVDIALINLACRDDIIVTQDYGVAAMALGKGCIALHQDGMLYTDENIDGLLMQRHMARKARQSGKHHFKGPSKRTAEDDRRFKDLLKSLLSPHIQSADEKT